MTSAISPLAQRFLATMNGIDSRLERVQRQISTGRKISSASDDPAKTSQILDYRADIERLAQISTNLGQVKGEAESADKAISSAITLIERARVIAVQGANATMGASERGTMAVEVQGLLERLVVVADTTFNGRRLFSGDSDQASPFTLDPASATGVSAYAGSAATRRIEHPSGGTFRVALSGDELFNNPSGNSVFQAVNQLRTALLANDQTAIASAVQALRDAGDHLNAGLSFYGSMESTVSAAISTTQEQILTCRTALSSLEDTDITEAILELTEVQTQREAALASRAQLPRTTLFDYLG